MSNNDDFDYVDKVDKKFYDSLFEAPMLEAALPGNKMDPLPGCPVPSETAIHEMHKHSPCGGVGKRIYGAFHSLTGSRYLYRCDKCHDDFYGPLLVRPFIPAPDSVPESFR